MNDPWTGTTGWRLTVGVGVGRAVESKGKNWDNCKRTVKLKNKKVIKNKIKYHNTKLKQKRNKIL